MAGVISALKEWTPSGDEAVILTRVHDLVSLDTPLAGAYSTRGWSHPGPIMFWLVALPSWLGSRPSLSLAWMAALNAVFVAALAWFAWRRGGLVLLVLVLTLTALLVNGLRGETLIWIWNPYVALLPYLVFTLAIWSVACRDPVALPVAVLFGSIVVQLHVAYVPLVAAAIVLTIVGTRWRSRPLGLRDRARSLFRPARWSRPVRWSVAIAVVLWSPVAVDLLVGDRNLVRVVQYFATGRDRSTIGVASGLGILSRELGPSAPWTGGDEQVELGSVTPGHLWVLIGAVALIGASTFWSYRRLRADQVLLGLLALAEVLVAGWAASRLEQPLLDYLVVWMLPLAMFVWLAILWPLAETAAAAFRSRFAGARSGRSARAVTVAIPGLVTLALFLQNPSSWTNPPLPRDYYQPAVAASVQQLTATLPKDRPLRVEFAGDEFFEAGPGIVHGLLDAGYVVSTSDGAPASKWGRSRAWQGQPVGDVLTVVVALPFAETDLIARCDASGLAQRASSYEPLTTSERDELMRLGSERYVNAGALDESSASRLAELQNRDRRVVVFRGGQPCQDR